LFWLFSGWFLLVSLVEKSGLGFEKSLVLVKRYLDYFFLNFLIF